MSQSRSHTIKCAHCKQTHSTVAQVRLCAKKAERAKRIAEHEAAATVPVVALPDTFNEEWAAMKIEAARREDEQERKAYMMEMAR